MKPAAVCVSRWPAAITAAAALALAGPAMAQIVVPFTDATFPDANWSALKVFDTTPGQGATFTAMQVSTGGNPGPFRYTRHNFCQGTMIVAHLTSAAVYDPSTQGAIASISAAFDLIHLNAPPGQAVAYGILLLQGEAYYTTPIGDTVVDPTWTHIDLGTLRSSDLQRLVGPGPTTPDFSAAGGPIHFGYYSGNTSAGACLVRESGIDNWSVTVRRACPGDLTGEGLVNLQDFFFFLQFFAEGVDPRADFNGDGQINLTDFFLFLQAFADGCA
jgi:hypothetical protein